MDFALFAPKDIKVFIINPFEGMMPDKDCLPSGLEWLTGEEKSFY